MPVVGTDFWYVTAGSIKSREEMDYELTDASEARLAEGRRAGSIVNCLMVRCFKTKCMFGHAIPMRDGQENAYVVDLITSDVAWLGHVKLVLKSDGEPAIVALAKRSLENIKCNLDGMEQVNHEKSHPRDSKSNGGTEVGIRIVRGMLRTHTMCLEKRLGFSIPPQPHPH